MPKTIEISHRTIIFIFLFSIGAWFLWAIKDIILQFLIAIILMTALNPVVNYLDQISILKYRLSRSLSIAIVYCFLFILVGLFIALITQPLISQTSSLIKQLPLLLNNINGLGIEKTILEQSITQLSMLPSDLFKIIINIFSNILALFTTTVMSLYLLLERNNLHRHLTDLLGNKMIEKNIENFIDQLETTLGGWIRAELFLMLIVGTFTYLGLLMLKIPYALPLAMVAGILELLPNIGPTISAIPAVFIGLTISPLVAIGVISLYIIIQLLENNIIVPQVMSQKVGVNPLITILLLLIGYNLEGVRGAILSIPIALIIRNFARFYFSGKFRPITVN